MNYKEKYFYHQLILCTDIPINDKYAHFLKALYLRDQNKKKKKFVQTDTLNLFTKDVFLTSRLSTISVVRIIVYIL